jgi:hypothetical protein
MTFRRSNLYTLRLCVVCGSRLPVMTSKRRRLCSRKNKEKRYAGDTPQLPYDRNAKALMFELSLIKPGKCRSEGRPVKQFYLIVSDTNLLDVTNSPFDAKCNRLSVVFYHSFVKANLTAYTNLIEAVAINKISAISSNCRRNH